MIKRTVPLLRHGMLVCSIYSSSMLAYNFFHWVKDSTPLIWDNIKYTRVFFEVKLSTIKYSPAPANMDVVLIFEDKIHMIESKFTEYFAYGRHDMQKLSEGYLKQDRFHFRNEQFLQTIQKWKKNAAEQDKENHYYDGIKQQICHLTAIINLLTQPDGRIGRIANAERFLKRNNNAKELAKLFEGKVIMFTNLIFDPSMDSFEEEFKAYDDYKTLSNKFANDLCNMTPHIQTIAYSDLWEHMQEQIPDDLKHYLKDRYMRWSNIRRSSTKNSCGSACTCCHSTNR